MTQYLIRRLILAIPVVLGVTFFAYSMVLLTGDPAAALAGEHVTPQMRAALREKLGLDDPLPVQYGRFLARIAQGDLGTSLISRIPVATELRLFFPATIELALAALIIAIVVGVPLGVIAGYKHNSFADLGTTIGSLIGVSMPIFWLALIMLWIFGLKLGWFPIGGRIDRSVDLQIITNLYILDSMLTLNVRALLSALHHLALPAIALATIPTAFITRITRSAMLDVLGENYVRTARAKGLEEKSVVARHALKNAMLPVITVIGLQIGSLMTGAILTETIFAWPGMGRWIVNAILARNFPVVQTGVMVFALIYVFVNLAVDVSYGWFNPRIRYS
ncbi:MAG: ABC transporter permease [Chloroflexi bacterium]|nr:ABC transporter permease [Chloroflexota bacterium]MCH8875494.1 ABC transporter permease [Chloroflexota bacterium]MCI0805390.1 ABC transporter permease [Chloroflexota bacterium]MCI0827025.1 ABC transporter permease [Chloroflexota bacterium]